MEELKKMMQNMTAKYDNLEIKFDNLEKRFDNLEKRFNNLEKEVQKKADKQDFDNLRKEILDKMFLFEQEYGSKIDIILDAVKMQLDQNSEKTEKMRELEARIEKIEINVFNHESRIHRLEMSKKFV